MNNHKNHDKDIEILSVLTLNLRFGLADDGPNSWQHRKKAFVSFFKSHCFDFIGLQEANNFQTEFLSTILCDYDYIGKRDPAPSFWQDNIIFYKNTWKCIHKEHFYLSPTPEVPSRPPRSRWARQCTMGLFENRGRKLICANTHFDFERSVQIESAKIIMERLLHLPDDLPVILIGDFNATPSCPCHEIFTGHGEGKGICLKNIFKKPYPGTHHGFTGNKNGNYIDWILYRGRIIPRDYRVIQDTVDGIYLSDHFPIYAKFEWEIEE
jgi:endonuclease/exonuclease/phosphatase family metal-dependent hydrolase